MRGDAAEQDVGVSIDWEPLQGGFGRAAIWAQLIDAVQDKAEVIGRTRPTYSLEPDEQPLKWMYNRIGSLKSNIYTTLNATLEDEYAGKTWAWKDAEDHKDNLPTYTAAELRNPNNWQGYVEAIRDVLDAMDTLVFAGWESTTLTMDAYVEAAGASGGYTQWSDLKQITSPNPTWPRIGNWCLQHAGFNADGVSFNAGYLGWGNLFVRNLLDGVTGVGGNKLPYASFGGVWLPVWGVGTYDALDSSEITGQLLIGGYTTASQTTLSNFKIGLMDSTYGGSYGERIITPAVWASSAAPGSNALADAVSILEWTSTVVHEMKFVKIGSGWTRTVGLNRSFAEGESVTFHLTFENDPDHSMSGLPADEAIVVNNDNHWSPEYPDATAIANREYTISWDLPYEDDAALADGTGYLIETKAAAMTWKTPSGVRMQVSAYIDDFGQLRAYT